MALRHPGCNYGVAALKSGHPIVFCAERWFSASYIFLCASVRWFSDPRWGGCGYLRVAIVARASRQRAVM